MDSIIKKIYNGFDIPLSDMIGAQSQDYEETRNTAFQAEQLFRKKLPSELIEQFDSFMELQLLVTVAGAEDGFIQGFRFGTKLTLETLL